jgi:hypothetical protein
MTVAEADALAPLYRDTKAHRRARKCYSVWDKSLIPRQQARKAVVGKLRPSRRPKGL